VVPGGEFYDYADKYLDDAAELRIPAPLDEVVANRLRELAVQAYGAIGGSGMARVDFLMGAGGEIFINEINTLPGFTSISMYPKLWEASGVPIRELALRLVEAAVLRHRDRHRLNQSIRNWTDSLAR
jgi:D-alanine-D-alanine ligase